MDNQVTLTLDFGDALNIAQYAYSAGIRAQTDITNAPDEYMRAAYRVQAEDAARITLLLERAIQNAPGAVD